jgi:23S rRNA (uracil1939-C5)-methyltransferase
MKRGRTRDPIRRTAGGVKRRFADRHGGGEGEDARSQDEGRVAAICPHDPDCVGCAFVGLAYGEQLARKRRRVVDELAAYPSLAHLDVPSTVGSPRPFGYRNQAKLVARRARRGLLFGIYRPGTHQVVDISRCPVHQPLINDTLAALRFAVLRHEVPIHDERTGEGWLRYVVLRTSAWKRCAQVILVVRDRNFPGEKKFLESVRRIRGVRSVVLNVNVSSGNVILAGDFVAITRENALIERVGGLELKSRAGSFLQANIQVARRIYEHVLDRADPAPDDVAVDLYAGVGAISFCLATRARIVYGVEESALAVLDAKENIRLNGFHNVRFTSEPAGQGLARLVATVGQVDLVTLNPPRKGADEPTRAAIVSAAPRRIVYVSCNPTTLARDLDWFAAHAYRTTALQPFDLLPQTDHVECVAVLERQGKTAPGGRVQ